MRFTPTVGEHVAELVWQQRALYPIAIVIVGVVGSAAAGLLTLAVPSLPSISFWCVAPTIVIGSGGGIVVLSLLRTARIVRAHPEAYPVRPVVVTLSPTGITVDGGTRSVVAWSGVTRITDGWTEVRLHTSRVTGVAVPRRAFATAADRKAFVERARALHAAAADAPPEAIPEGDDAWLSLDVTLTADDYARWMEEVRSRQIDRTASRGRAIGIALILGLLYLLCGVMALLEGSAVPFALPGMLTAFAAAVWALRVRQRRRPMTPLVRAIMERDPARFPDTFRLVLDDGGLWSRSARGISRQRWADLTEVWELDAHAVIMVGPARGIVIPKHVLPDPQAFLARTRGAIEAAVAPGSPVPDDDVRRPPGGTPDPFAAPEL